MALGQKQLTMAQWKAQQIAQDKSSHAVMDALIKYRRLAERTWVEAFLWGFFIPGGGQFLLNKSKEGFVFLLLGVATFVIFCGAVASRGWVVAGWTLSIGFLSQMTGAVWASLKAGEVSETASFMCDEIIKVQNASGK